MYMSSRLDISKLDSVNFLATYHFQQETLQEDRHHVSITGHKKGNEKG